jgi:hypothetical protein
MNAMSAIKLPKFSGDSSQRAVHWLTLFDQYVAFHNLTPERQLAAFPFTLDNEASSWYSFLPQETTNSMEALREAFKARFEEESPQWSFSSLKQKDGETINEYATRIQKMGMGAVSIPEIVQVKAASEGLRATYRPIVMQADPHTWADFRKHAQIAERTASAMLTTAPATVSAVHEPEQLAMSQVLVSLAGILSNLQTRDTGGDNQRQAPPRQPANTGTHSKQYTQANTHTTQPYLHNTPPYAEDTHPYEHQQHTSPQPYHQTYQQSYRHNSQPQFRSSRPPPPAHPQQSQSSYPPNPQSVCMRCGRDCNRQNCPAKDKLCYNCGRMGHFTRICQAGRRSNRYQ